MTIAESHSGSGENCSPSRRNPVRLQPGILFVFTPESFRLVPESTRASEVLALGVGLGVERVVGIVGVADRAVLGVGGTDAPKTVFTGAGPVGVGVEPAGGGDHLTWGQSSFCIVSF